MVMAKSDSMERPSAEALSARQVLARKLLRWFPQFRDKLKSSAAVSFYTRFLTEITSVFIKHDLEFVTSNLLEKGSSSSQIAYKNKFL
jgi:TorA maturation chaperone TorD